MNNVFTEKYRPNIVDNIILDKYNKKILNSIIETLYFPNLLFFGPPGTGKTTTIINLIKKYQEKLGETNKGLIIHLNASDERGIDIIRTQINNFVKSKILLNNGLKFIILDEVDYMTINAQKALKCLIQQYSDNVRYCLICNYITRIDDGLQNIFLKLKFNQLPKNEIISFLKKIIIKEEIIIPDDTLILIQEFYNSDIRSMINFIQINQNINKNSNKSNIILKIIDNNILEYIYNLLKKNNIKNINKIIEIFNKLIIEYEIDFKNIIKNLINYIIRFKATNLTNEFFIFIENIMHFENYENNELINYTIYKLLLLIK